MARPVIQGTWDDDIFVDVEGSDDALSEDVNYIFIGVCTVVKLRTKGGLPLLGLQDAVRVGRVKEETFKLQLADAAEIGALFEGYVGVVTKAIGALEKPDFRVEIWADLASLGKEFQPVIFVTRVGAEICLTTLDAGRATLRGITHQNEVLHQHHARVHSPSLIERRSSVPGPLFDPHDSDVRASAECSLA